MPMCAAFYHLYIASHFASPLTTYYAKTITITSYIAIASNTLIEEDFKEVQYTCSYYQEFIIYIERESV